MEYEDESLRGSYKVIEISNTSTYIKPHFKAGKEHRFMKDAIIKVKADEPIMTLIANRDNEWTSARDIIIGTGLAERTVYHMCSRLVLHEVLEMKYGRLEDTQGHKRKTRLYRLVVKSMNESGRGNKKGIRASKSNARKIK